MKSVIIGPIILLSCTPRWRVASFPSVLTDYPYHPLLTQDELKVFPNWHMSLTRDRYWKTDF